MAEKNFGVLQDMNESWKTVLGCAVGMTKQFMVEVGLHQRSALSSLLFAVVMVRLTDDARQNPLWTVIFKLIFCSFVSSFSNRFHKLHEKHFNEYIHLGSFSLNKELVLQKTQTNSSLISHGVGDRSLLLLR